MTNDTIVSFGVPSINYTTHNLTLFFNNSNIGTASNNGNVFWVSGAPCQTLQERYPNPIDDIHWRVLFALAYTCIMCTAVIGNLCVIYVGLYRPTVSFTVRTVFIVTLALSDIVISMTSLPITAVTILARTWQFGDSDLLCSFMNMSMGAGIFVSSFTLVAIAVDRYLLIAYPARHFVTFQRAAIAAVCIIIAGYTATTPLAVYSGIQTYDEICGNFCAEDWTSLKDGNYWRALYGSTVMAVQFGTPIVICTACYTGISLAIKRQIKRRCQMDQLSTKKPATGKRLNARRSRSNRMMVAMVMCFTLSYLPMNTLNIGRDVWIWLEDEPYFTLLFGWAHVAAMTTTIWNPLLYAWFNDAFRRMLTPMLPGFLARLVQGHSERPQQGTTNASPGVATNPRPNASDNPHKVFVKTNSADRKCSVGRQHAVRLKQNVGTEPNQDGTDSLAGMKQVSVHRVNFDIIANSPKNHGKLSCNGVAGWRRPGPYEQMSAVRRYTSPNEAGISVYRDKIAALNTSANCNLPIKINNNNGACKRLNELDEHVLEYESDHFDDHHDEHCEQDSEGDEPGAELLAGHREQCQGLTETRVLLHSDDHVACLLSETHSEVHL